MNTGIDRPDGLPGRSVRQRILAPPRTANEVSSSTRIVVMIKPATAITQIPKRTPSSIRAAAESVFQERELIPLARFTRKSGLGRDLVLAFIADGLPVQPWQVPENLHLEVVIHPTPESDQSMPGMSYLELKNAPKEFILEQMKREPYIWEHTNGVFYVIFYDGPLGDRKRRESLETRDRRTAEDRFYFWRRQKAQEEALGIRQVSIPYGEAIAEFLAQCEKRFKPASVHRYKNALENIGAFLGSEQRLSDIGVKDLQDYQPTRVHIAEKRTVDYELDVLRTFLNWCRKRSWVQGNVASKQSVARIKIRPKTLRVPVWNTKIGRMSIREAAWSPKSYEKREIPIEPRLLPVLEEFERKRADNVYSLYFLSKTGCQVTDHLARDIKRVSGSQDVSAHTFRHTHISFALNRWGRSPTIVQRWVGHKKLDTTILYVHTSLDDLIREAQKTGL